MSTMSLRSNINSTKALNTLNGARCERAERINSREGRRLSVTNPADFIDSATLFGEAVGELYRRMYARVHGEWPYGRVYFYELVSDVEYIANRREKQRARSTLADLEQKLQWGVDEQRVADYFMSHSNDMSILMPIDIQVLKDRLRTPFDDQRFMKCARKIVDALEAIGAN